jgi:hypothetical protein
LRDRSPGLEGPAPHPHRPRRRAACRRTGGALWAIVLSDDVQDLEYRVDEHVARALERMGMPSIDTLQVLTDEVRHCRPNCAA